MTAALATVLTTVLTTGPPPRVSRRRLSRLPLHPTLLGAITDDINNVIIRVALHHPSRADRPPRHSRPGRTPSSRLSKGARRYQHRQHTR